MYSNIRRIAHSEASVTTPAQSPTSITKTRSISPTGEESTEGERILPHVRLDTFESRLAMLSATMDPVLGVPHPSKHIPNGMMEAYDDVLSVIRGDPDVDTLRNSRAEVFTGLVDSWQDDVFVKGNEELRDDRVGSLYGAYYPRCIPSPASGCAQLLCPAFECNKAPVQGVGHSIVGASKTISQVIKVLAERRAVSIVGPMGCGKTEIARAVCDHMRVAHKNYPGKFRFEQGVWWVPLASCCTFPR